MDYAEKYSPVGKKIGPYTVERQLGAGGMGVVYLGRDDALERSVAIKTLAQAFVMNETWLARFHREAKAAARLRHPNIVQVYGVDLEAVPPYIVMEYVEGEPLDALLRERGTLSWQHALTICGQVAAALECAHNNGVIHRDVKPGNILIDGNGQAHVTDFGVAKLLDSSTKLTSSGAMIGTPQYMSPEQFGAGEVGPASDLFSLGTVTFEMLTGQLPFKADTPAGLVKKITLDAPENTLDEMKLPVAVTQFVTGLLQKETEHRYPTAKAVLQDLRQIHNEQALVHAPAAAVVDLSKSVVDDLLEGVREAPLPPAPLFQQRSVSPWLLGAVAVLAASVIGLMALMARGPGSGGARPDSVPQLRGSTGGEAPAQPVQTDSPPPRRQPPPPPPPDTRRQPPPNDPLGLGPRQGGALRPQGAPPLRNPQRPRPRPGQNPRSAAAGVN